MHTSATTGSVASARRADDPQGDRRDEGHARREAVEAVDEVDAVDHPDGPDHHEDGTQDALQPDGPGAEGVGDGPDGDAQPHRAPGRRGAGRRTASARAGRTDRRRRPIATAAAPPSEEGGDLRPGQRVPRPPEAHQRVGREERRHHDEEGDAHRHAAAAGHGRRVHAALVRDGRQPSRAAPCGAPAASGRRRGAAAARNAIAAGTRRSRSPVTGSSPGGRPSRLRQARDREAGADVAHLGPDPGVLGRLVPRERAPPRAGARPRASRRGRSRGSWWPASRPGSPT